MHPMGVRLNNKAMKTITKLQILVAGLVLGLTGACTTTAQVGYNQPGYNQPDYNQQPGYNQYDQQYGSQGQNQDFYNELGPHGQWVQTPEYGTVWVPNVEPGFQPYATNGHWVVTEYGNTWVSDYSWGWAPFHYGRWFQDRYQRWAWVPGNDWGPAWVSWRSGGGYYGWAPLGPGININVNANIPSNYWVFVPQIYITSPRLFSYYVPRPRVVNIYQSTTIINNVYQVNNRSYAYGPRREEIERVTRRSVPVYRIENSGRPGRTVVQNNSVGIYRPEMNRGSRGNGGETRTDQPRDYSRRDYAPNAGNPAGTSRPNPVQTNDNPRYQPREQASPVNPRSGQSRYQNEQRVQPQVQQNQPVPQQNQPTQPSTYPQSRRQESFPQPQREANTRQESFPQRQNSQPADIRQPQLQRQNRIEQRVQPQPQPQGRSQAPEQAPTPPGATPERRGGSRGPR